MAFCTHCGKALPDGAAVCPACGREAKLNAKEDTRGQGKITFTRVSSIMSKAVKMHVIIDGKTVRKLKENESVTVVLPYGRHQLTLKMPLSPVYKSSFVIDEENRDIRCSFAIVGKTGRPQPVSIKGTNRKKGETNLLPDSQTKAAERKWEQIKVLVVVFACIALLIYAVLYYGGPTAKALLGISLLVLAVVVAVFLRYRKKAQLRQVPQERAENSRAEKEEKKMEQNPDAAKPAESAQKPTMSIYENIQQHLQDGELPRDFVIEGAETRSKAAKFAPGAMDGILLYHMTPYTADEETKEQILQALRLICEEDNARNVPQIMDIFEKLEHRASVVKLYDAIIEVMLKNMDSLDPEKLLQFGDYLVSYGITFLAVKLGLSLLGIFTEKVAFVKEVHLTLGAYDEFTWFAARYFSSGACKGGNEDLFRLAKHVCGWGRIHAVAYLEADTKEISDWLLYEGAENTILPQYSADLCLLKAGAAHRLREGVTEEEFNAIGKLMQYALEGGPCPGLSYANELVPAYLEAAKRFPAVRELLQSLRDYCGEIEMQEAADLADQLLRA